MAYRRQNPDIIGTENLHPRRQITTPTPSQARPNLPQILSAYQFILRFQAVASCIFWTPAPHQSSKSWPSPQSPPPTSPAPSPQKQVPANTHKSTQNPPSKPPAPADNKSPPASDASSFPISHNYLITSLKFHQRYTTCAGNCLMVE
jgi:hypothetical protein